MPTRIIYGTTGPDFIRTPDGHDPALTWDNVVYPLGGADTVVSGSGNDWVWGQFGDTVSSVRYQGGSGNNVAIMFGGDNSLAAGSGNATLIGGSGNDTLIGGSGSHELWAGAGNNVLIGGSGRQVLASALPGQTGNNLLIAGTGGAALVGGAGNDTLYGGTGFDWLWAGSGNTLLVAGDGHTQVLKGGPGNDTLIASGALYHTDSVSGGGGRNLIYGGGLRGGGSGPAMDHARDVIIGVSATSTVNFNTGGGSEQDPANGTQTDLCWDFRVGFDTLLVRASDHISGLGRRLSAMCRTVAASREPAL